MAGSRGSVQHTEAPAIGLRTAALVQLGAIMRALGSAAEWPGHGSGLTREEFDQLEGAIQRAEQHNGWATGENVRYAIAGWGEMLQEVLIEKWLGKYPDLQKPRSERTVGLVLAGNVPLVGLHDVICVWLAGHIAQVKCSSQEPELIPALVQVLEKLLPGTADRIRFADGKLGEVEAVIATGSNNTARYFDHYFGHLPRIVRKSRVSVAVLDGSETDAELEALGEDVFRYFGLGCRNVSKVLLPEDFDLDRIFKAFFPFQNIIQHNKYANNYDHTRALWLLDGVTFLENGFVLLKEDRSLASPVGSLFYERYFDRKAVEEELIAHAEEIQCVVGHGKVPFGKAQLPAIDDYADGVDTMEFLIKL